jgi:hypothetical protein
VKISSEYKLIIEGGKAIIDNTKEQIHRYAILKISKESIITNDSRNGITIRYNRYKENK